MGGHCSGAEEGSLTYDPPKTLIGTWERAALTHRYLYYVMAQSIMSDQAYDELEKRCLDHPDLPPDSPLRLPGADCASAYPADIKENAKRLLKKTKMPKQY